MIRWSDIIGMRHRLAHAYFDINLSVLWRTVRDDLPPLVASGAAHRSGRALPAVGVGPRSDSGVRNVLP